MPRWRDSDVMRRLAGRGGVVVLVCTLASLSLLAGQTEDAPLPQVFFDAASLDDKVARPALDRLAASWKDSYAAMIIDMVRLMRRAPRQGEPDIMTPSFGDEEAGAASA